MLKSDQYKTGDLAQKSDEEILALSITRPSVFEILVGRYGEAFRRKLFPIFRGFEEDAEDVVQETFVKIYINAGRFRPMPGASFKSWGYKILLNTAFSFLKKRNREQLMTADLDPEYYEALPDKADEANRRLIIDEALSIFSRMPSVFVEVLKPTIIDGHSQEQIAKNLGLSLGAVRTRVHRAKKEFKKIGFSLR